MIAIRDPPEIVGPECECPACGERRIDRLHWTTDELVRCLGCQSHYYPGDAIRETSYRAARDELIQRVSPIRGPDYYRYCQSEHLEIIASELEASLMSSESGLLDTLAPWGVSTMEVRAALDFLAACGLVSCDGGLYIPRTPRTAVAALVIYNCLKGGGP